MKKKRVVIYARSSKEVDGASGKVSSTGDQVSDVRRLCEAHGYLVVRVFEEVESRNNYSRPAFKEMLEFARKGGCDAIAVWKIDRMGASLRHLLNTVADLEQWGVNLISFTEGIDTSTEMGSMFFKISAIFSEYEYNRIVDRTRWGVQNALKNGTKSGRPFGRPPIAYDKVREAVRLMGESVQAKHIRRRTEISRGTYYKIKRVRDAIIIGDPIDEKVLKGWDISTPLYNHVARACKALYDVKAPAI